MKKNIFGFFLLGAGMLISATSCSDEFLKEKKNYDNVTSEVYNDFTGANTRLNDIYAWCLPDASASANWKYNCTGLNDEQSKSTEEYSGFSQFTDPQNEMLVTLNNLPDYFHYTSKINASPWGRIRNVNDVISGITNGTLSDSEKEQLLGQAYFLRAWCYYNLVKWYGGVPIITTVQDPTEDSYTPRSSIEECINFILSDLDTSAKMLAPFTMNGGWSGDDWGRVTTGTALALKGRVLMLWCSPIFNRANDESRWTSAYNTMKQELDSIDACGYGLYSSTNNVNGSDFARMFTLTQSSEAVFVTLYNTQTSDDYQKSNSWERYIRPSNTTGSGYNASAMLVDEFPMADGKRPATCNTYTKLEPSDSTYDSNYPFMARDPRFYRTFAFPGMRWAYSGDATPANANNPSYDAGTNYTLWNYVWYTSADDAGDVESGNDYGADNLLTSTCGVYVRKRSDDYDVNSSPFYSFNATQSNGGFEYDAAPYLEIRYAEVLLNLAEAACGAGDLDYAVEQLKKIRARAGYTAENNYGLQDNLNTDQATCMSAILYERQIEFAYEGKRFDDLRRWLLYDGGAHFGEISGAPESWILTGWGGNTCTWLGFKQLNGQRRENMEFRTKDELGVGGEAFYQDPVIMNYATNNGTSASSDNYYDLAALARPDGVDLRKSDLTSQLNTLKSWYEENLVRKTKKGDAYDSNKIPLYIDFLPRYYFLGLGQAALNNNVNMPQTIGWTTTSGAAGTFDPFVGE
jgi:hypothetical protein